MRTPFSAWWLIGAALIELAYFEHLNRSRLQGETDNMRASPLAIFGRLASLPKRSINQLLIYHYCQCDLRSTNKPPPNQGWQLGADVVRYGGGSQSYWCSYGG